MWLMRRGSLGPDSVWPGRRWRRSAVEGECVDHPRALPHGEPSWTYLDEHLWHTCDILADLVSGRLQRRPRLATYARLAPNERVLAVGPAQRLTWRARGNGSYQHTNVVAVGRPSFVIGSMLGSALGNASRRRAAAAAAQPRWVLDGSGELTVTDQGAYFGHPRAPVSLYWTGVTDSIDLVGPEDFQIALRTNQGGHCTLRFHTPWASLLFVLAARARFTAHPRLLHRGWLPADFENRCARMGRPCPLVPPLVPDSPAR